MHRFSFQIDPSSDFSRSADRPFGLRAQQREPVRIAARSAPSWSAANWVTLLLVMAISATLAVYFL